MEKAELTSGSTWHAAGQVTHSVSSYVLAEFRRYACELYASLEAETQVATSWHRSGSLRIAYRSWTGSPLALSGFVPGRTWPLPTWRPNTLSPARLWRCGWWERCVLRECWATRCMTRRMPGCAPRAEEVLT